MSCIKIILIPISYIIGTLIIYISPELIHEFIYITGYIVLCIGIYKLLKLPLQLLIKVLKTK